MRRSRRNASARRSVTKPQSIRVRCHRSRTRRPSSEPAAASAASRPCALSASVIESLDMSTQASSRTTGTFPSLKDRGNLFEIATQQMTKGADAIKLDPAVRQILAQPKNELIINFPVRLDDGSYEIFKG